MGMKKEKGDASVQTHPLELFMLGLLITQQRELQRYLRCSYRHSIRCRPGSKELLLQQQRCRYRSKNPAQSSDHKMRKIQLQQLRT